MKMNANVKILGRLTPHKFPWQENVIDIQVDATLDVTGHTAGDRYIITNSASLHASFGTITGVGNGDIVESNGSTFDVVWDASVNGEGAKVYDKDSNGWYEFDGSNWAAEAGSTVSVLDDLTDVTISGAAGGHVLVNDGGGQFDNVAISGDITLSSAGVAAIAAGVITNADINAAAAIVESKLSLDFSTSSLNSSIGANTADIADLRTTQGTADGDTHLGTFTGSTISDNGSVKAGMQELETAVETKAASSVVNDLITLSGVAGNSTNLGTFTGSKIADNETIKGALQDLEDAVEANEALVNGLEWQDSALDYVTDNTLVPASEVSGDRYVLSHDGGVPHANYDGASAGDIVEFNGTTWDATTPTTGMFISVDDQVDVLYYWGGAAWVTKSFEATTASTGLTKSGVDIQLADAASNNGVSVSSGAISLALLTAGGLKFTTNEVGVEPADFAGTGLEDDGSDNLRLAAQGNGIAGGAGSTLSVDLDGSTLSLSASGVRVAAGALSRYTTATHIAGTTVTITHNLGLSVANACHISMFDATTGEPVFCDNVDFTSGNALDLNFASSVSANSLRINISSAEDIT